jgi:hypothetical protein
MLRIIDETVLKDNVVYSMNIIVAVFGMKSWRSSGTSGNLRASRSAGGEKDERRTEK